MVRNPFTLAVVLIKRAGLWVVSANYLSWREPAILRRYVIR